MCVASGKELFELGRLSLRPTYGQEIVRRLRRSHPDFWVERSETHVFDVLRKLSREGLVAVTDDHDDGPSQQRELETTVGRRTLSDLPGIILGKITGRLDNEIAWLQTILHNVTRTVWAPLMPVFNPADTGLGLWAPVRPGTETLVSDTVTCTCDLDDVVGRNLVCRRRLQRTHRPHSQIEVSKPVLVRVRF